MLGVQGGEIVQGVRWSWTARLRRPVLLVAVTLLCGAAFMAGIWFGAQGGIACVVTEPGTIVCGAPGEAPPVQPAATPIRNVGSA